MTKLMYRTKSMIGQHKLNTVKTEVSKVFY